MVSFNAIISTLSVAIAATNAQVNPGQPRADISFFPLANCGNFLEQHSVFLPNRVPPGDGNARPVNVCFNTTRAFASVAVDGLINNPPPGEACTFNTFSGLGCTGRVTSQTSAAPLRCRGQVAGLSWRVDCVRSPAT
ncbi:hypothetical protein HYFRA_00005990 [Hymenoscyphus fraxineus]|uniref:Uncharacterized protein n=1 Tax=Hymenoscyphus fraxineus TaxID=746836 RepID=A0A9N9PSP1_9HELO|nr:hypothetical protein HYFRA_00005990 [Hymenoscyphus fraxineus]